MARKLGELESEVKENFKKTQFAIDEALVATRKAKQAVDDLEAVRTMQHEMQTAFDENAEILDSYLNEFNELKEQIASGAVAVDGATGGGASAQLTKTVEESMLSVQDISERLDALAKDSGAARMSLEDVVKNTQSLKHAMEEHARGMKLIDDTRAEMQRQFEEFQQRMTATEEGLQTSLLIGTEDKIETLGQELRQLIDTRGGASGGGGVSGPAVEQLTARVASVENQLAGLTGADDALKKMANASGLIDNVIARGEDTVRGLERIHQRLHQTDNDVNAIITRVEESSKQMEANYDRMRLAMRLVDELQDKVRRGGGGGPSTSAMAPPGEELDESIPDATDLGFELTDLLQVMMKHNASDLHLKVGAPPTVRLDGELIPVGSQVLTEKDCKRLIYTSITPAQKRYLLTQKELEYAYTVPGARFRISAFIQRGTVSASFRLLRTEMPTVEQLGLPAVLKKLVSFNSGLLLVTGPVGSGRSTTLAALLEHINTHRKMHIITVEHPIEFMHKDNMSLITQREIGTDALDYHSALRQALRQDPNVIMVGELRDPATIMLAAVAAETGHLVISTLSTPNTIQAVERMIECFSGEQQRQFRTLLANNLKGVVSQRLLTRADEQGRVAAVEVLVVTPAISGLILEGKTAEIYNHLLQGTGEGMQTFSAALTRLYEAGLITKEEALNHNDQPNEYRSAPEVTPAAGSAPQQPASFPGQPAPQAYPQAGYQEADPQLGWL
ncbi:MAG TPA: PilT/PilU family type 4a pilus ATPase [Candidatus Xenobia bacterium]